MHTKFSAYIKNICAHGQSQDVHSKSRLQIIYWISLCDFNQPLASFVFPMSKKWMCKCGIFCANHIIWQIFFCSLVSKKIISFTKCLHTIMGDHINNECNLLPSYLHFMFWTFFSSSHGKPLKWHSCFGWHMVCFTVLCTTHGPFAPSMHMHQHNQGMASLNGILFKDRKVDATFHFQMCIVDALPSSLKTQMWA